MFSFFFGFSSSLFFESLSFQFIHLQFFNFMSFFIQKDVFLIVHIVFFAENVSYPLLFETVHKTCAFCIYIPQLCFDDDELQMYFCMTE